MRAGIVTCSTCIDPNGKKITLQWSSASCLAASTSGSSGIPLSELCGSHPVNSLGHHQALEEAIQAEGTFQ